MRLVKDGEAPGPGREVELVVGSGVGGAGGVVVGSVDGSRSRGLTGEGDASLDLTSDLVAKMGTAAKEREKKDVIRSIYPSNEEEFALTFGRAKSFILKDRQID